MSDLLPDFVTFLIFVLSLVLFASQSLSADHASVLLYHHISNTAPKSTSVSPTVFEQHMAYLHEQGFSVLPLENVLETLRSGGELPGKTIAITFDDAYRSIMDHAVPILQNYGWPYTLFISTRAVDKGYKNYLSWDELATLVKEGAYIGNHSYSHTHLIDRLSGEDTTGWKNRIREDIQRAQEDIQKRLGVTPKLFSYPYGEFTTELQKLVSELGLFGITQKSGALDQDFDPLAVPRFPMAIPHDSLNRLIIAANARPLPVMLIDASPRMLSEEETATQRYEFSIHADGYRIDELACYNSGDGTRLETSKTYHNNEIRVSMQLPAWSAGVRKINCTAPSKREKNVFYWYSRLWIVYHSHKKPEQPE